MSLLQRRSKVAFKLAHHWVNPHFSFLAQKHEHEQKHKTSFTKFCTWFTNCQENSHSTGQALINVWTCTFGDCMSFDYRIQLNHMCCNQLYQKSPNQPIWLTTLVFQVYTQQLNFMYSILVVSGQSHRAKIPALLMTKITLVNPEIERRATRKYTLNAMEGSSHIISNNSGTS